MEGIQTTIKFTGPSDSIAVIKVGGYIDTTTSSELERALGSLLKKDQYRIIVDLADVDYISSAGWGIFISEIKGIKQNRGDLKLVRMIPEVYEVFELLEFHYILKAYDTLEDAVEAFVKEAGGDLKPTAKIVLDSEESEQPKTPAAKTFPTEKKIAARVNVEEDIHDDIVQVEDEEAGSGSVDGYIRTIVAKHPHFGTWQIKKMLNTAQYSYTKLGWFEIRKKLKELNLLSKHERYDYASQQ
jgi:anti-sigma B factor antagonist